MATRFEIVLHGQDASSLRAAGEEALDEIVRLEARLSLFRPGSEIAHLNARAAREPVRVTPGLFSLLEHAQRLHEETAGAFDITIAPLVRCWGFMGGTGQCPDPEALAEARSKIGMNLVLLDKKNFEVRFAREGVMLDLGAIGKGYAIEKAAELLRDGGVTSALIHGGTSTVYAIGAPPGEENWKVGIDEPARSRSVEREERQERGGPESSNTTTLPRSDAPTILATFPLRDEAMSVSGIRGKYFEADGKILGHILDPRTGHPAKGTELAAVVLPSATETDALSTALLILGSGRRKEIEQLRPGMRTFLVPFSI